MCASARARVRACMRAFAWLMCVCARAGGRAGPAGAAAAGEVADGSARTVVRVDVRTFCRTLSSATGAPGRAMLCACALTSMRAVIS